MSRMITVKKYYKCIVKDTQKSNVNIGRIAE